jgi:hypothetical protein
MHRRIVALTLVGGLIGGAALARAETRGGSIDPADFVRRITNPFFPLKPGTVFVYRGERDGQSQTDRVTVTHRRKTILGVSTVVVRDVATHHGERLEKTLDWFAQDRDGNVWYFGEATRTYEHGRVSTEGSWTGGVDGAQPGIVMEADPRIADGYRQEIYPGHADDRAWVLTLGGTITVPYGHLRHTLLTMEWTPLEPNVVDNKVYARGVGLVREISVAGPLESAELVRIERPAS